jgi:hypothetical protein
MVQFIQRGPSFGEQLGSSIGQGISKFSDMMTQLSLEKLKQKQLQDLITPKQSQSQAGTLSPQPQQSLWSSLTPEQKIALDLKNPQVARNLRQDEDLQLKREKLELQREAPEREAERKKAEDVLSKVATSKENILQRKQDMQMAETAILQNPGDISSVKSWASKAFNLPMLADASTAQFTAGIKDAYVQDVRKLGNRPNMWIEQQIESATARLGQSDEANLSIIAAGKAKLDIEDRHNEIVDRLEDSYLSKGMKVPSTIGKEAHKELKLYAKERYDELAYDLRSLFEKEQGEQSLMRNALKKVPQGTPLTLEMRDVLFKKIGADPENPTDKEIHQVKNMADNLGYEIPEENIYSRIR